MKTSLITSTNTGWKSDFLCCLNCRQCRCYCRKSVDIASNASTKGFLLMVEFFRFQSLPPTQDFSFLFRRFFQSTEKMKRSWKCVRKVFLIMIVEGGIFPPKLDSEKKNFWTECLACKAARVYLITKRVRLVLKWTKQGEKRSSRATIYLFNVGEMIKKCLKIFI